MTINEEILSKLHHIEQNLHWNVELGTSIDEVIHSGKFLLECAQKGFRFEQKHCMISNLKEVFPHLLEDVKDEKRDILYGIMKIAPDFTHDLE